MVRETRHLWIGNLPENVREEQIRDLFQRHGRVQSVKLVSSEDSSSGTPNNTLNSNSGSNTGVRGKNATVSFIDIRSAAKALRGAYNISGQPLHIKYYEPNSVPPRDTTIAAAEHENSSPVGGSMGDANNTTAPTGSDQVNSQSTSSAATSAIGHGPSENINMSGGGSTSNGPMSASSGNNSIGAPYRHQRFPVQHGQSEDSSHFYEQPKNFNRGRGDGSFHQRGRRDHRNSYHNRHQFQTDRNYNRMSNNWNYQNENRFAPPEGEDRSSGPSPVSHNSSSETGNKVPRCPESPGGSVSSRHMSRHKSRSVSESGSSDRGSSAGSRSRSGSRSSVSTSASSAHSRSPARRSAMGHFSRGGSIASNSSGRFHRNSYSRHRYSRSQLVSRPADSSRVHHSSRSSPVGASRSSSSSSSSSPHRKLATAPDSPSRSPSSTKSYSPSRSVNSGHHHHSSSSHRRPPNSTELACAIRIRNLPSRSTDSSLEDGLFHEYKKHGKVSWVRMRGGGPGRHAVVCFKSADQAARAVTLSQDKQFFGCKIQVSPYFEGGGVRMNGGGEEVTGVDEENRLNEEDFPSVPYPTRSVLINGLDSTVTTQELRQAFEQYGDIVDIRRVGGNTHAVCEFVDIASAIRAQWGRYVFKSREARISFFKSPPSSSLLLDGTANVTEKQVDSYCRQYGAIKNVIMDPARILALVQFESISSAQTASRELRSWVINRKHLHVDFASSVCTKMFIDRLKSLPNDIDDNVSVSSPRSLPPSNTSSKDSSSRSKKSGRKIDDSLLERKGRRRRDVNLEDGKYADELSASENLSRTVEQNSENQSGFKVGRSHNSTRRSRSDTRMSPVSPSNQDGEAEKKSGKPSKSSSSKIDLSCHETDSAVVTSSSDVICPEKNTPDVPPNHESSGSSNSHSTLEDPEVLVNDSGTGLITRKPITWSKPKNVIITVDGVSSTSPEPKHEAVRKVSPDSGTGSRIPVAESITRIAPLVYHMTNGPTDPRKKASDDQRRRASADSAHQEILSTTIPTRTARNSGSADNTMHDSSAESPTTDDLDDRPGTPLCDENPESFASDEPKVVPDRIRVQPPGRSKHLAKSDEPLSLPLPEFALKKQSKSGFTKTSSENLDKIPIIPLTCATGNNDESSTVTPTQGTCETLSASSKSSAVNVESKETTVVDETYSVKRQDASDKETSAEGSRISDESVLLVDLLNSPSPVSIHIDDKDDDMNSLSSSDSEGRSSRNSPTDEQLEQRIQKLYEQYDQWNGNRTAIKATTVPNSSLNFSLSSESSFLGGTKSSESTQDGEQSSSSLLNKPWFARTKPLSLDEMKHEPSDIVKSLLAKKSVFDEDSKRLENFEEKYEPKAISSINSTNWRQALNRSASTPSSVSLLSPTLSISSPSKAPVFSPSLSSHSSHSSSRSLSHTVAVSPSSSFGVSKPIGSHLSSSVSSLMKRRDSAHGESVKSELSKLNLNVKPTSIHSPGSDASSSGKSPNIATVHSRPLMHGSSDSPKTPTVRPGYCIKPKYSSTNPSESSSASTPGKDDTPARPQEKIASAVKNLISVSHANKPITPSVQTPTSAPPQVGIHHGIPRMVERSTSLDSKRNLISGNASSAAAHNSPATGQSSSTTNATPASRSNIAPPTINRRPSADINPSQVLPHGSASAHVKENSKPPAPIDNKITKPEIKEMTHVKEGAAKEPKPTPSLTILPQKEIAKPFRYDNLMKLDHVNMSHDQTVAVVSTVQQTPVLQAQKSSGNNSGNPDKEKSNGVNGNSGKRDKDKDAYLNNKKNHASGSGNSISNNIKPVPSHSNPKLSKERKEKEKDKSAKTPDVNNHHNENKKKEKEKEKVNDSSASHNQKKDKDKIRRSHSSQEKEEKDAKKIKLDKDALVDSKEINSHGLAHKNTSDRRESADLTSRTKSPKEKHANSTESAAATKVATVEKSETTTPPQVKVEKSDKDHHHHKSKASNGSSSSKHHHSSSDKLNSHKHKEKRKEDANATAPVIKDKEKEKSSSVSKSSSGKPEKVSSSKSSSVTNDSHKHTNHHKKEKETSNSTKSSATKDKVREREKDKSKVSTSSSFMTSVDSDVAPDHDDSPQTKSHSKDKNDKDKSKGDRRKSGGESSSAPGTAETAKSNSKEKVKQQKKRRRIVVDDSDSSSDEEEKHHSIFEVVVDEYVSMYDKVKSRSNRACKKTPQQQKEEERKQDKLQESFHQLKKSRAKREEKKRSTSIEERKSLNTSSDDDSHHSDTATHSDHSSKPKFDKGNTKPFKGLNTSDDDDDESQRTSKSSKSESRPKSKNSASGKSIKRPNKREISPIRPSSYLLSNSDQESDLEPVTKKQKLGSKHQIESMVVSDTKSTESDTEEDEKPRKLSKSSSSFLKNKQIKKKMNLDTYAESDNSGKSALGKKSSSQQSLLSGRSKKEKSSKQKSIDAMKKSLFDISNSSDESSKVESFSPKKEKVSSKHSSKSRTKSDKENKSGHKKSSSPSHSHRPSTSSNTSKKVKTKRKNQDSGKPHLIRRESSVLTTEVDLFGSMSSSNDTDTEIKHKPGVKEERPISPPLVSSSVEDKEIHSSSHKSKHSNSERSKQKKHSSSSQRNSHDNKDGDSHQSGKSSSEKKKRKHHKRSRHDEDQKKSPEKSVVKLEPFVDYSALFNSPPSALQPVIPGLRDEHPSNEVFKSEKLFPGLAPPSSSSARSSPARSKETDVVDEGMKIMFSSDEDEDEDTSLKIAEAIMASEDEKPADENLSPGELAMRKELEEKEAAAAARRLEEEIKRNCMFEQDKAIESILMERKSPAASVDVAGAHGHTGAEGEEGAKDHEPAISQEETEDAVAALLGTLGREDDEVEDGGLALEKPQATHSPPTLRIIEEASPSVPAVPEHERSVSPANGNSPWYAKSPELQIDEDAGKKPSEVEQRSPVPPPVHIPKTPEEKFDLLKKFTQEYGEGLETSTTGEESEKASVGSSQSRRNSRQSTDGRLRNDIYEFHDSDDEKTRRAKACAVPAPVVQQRNSADSLQPPIKSPVAASEPIINLPAISSPDTVVPKPPEIPLHVTIPQVDVKPDIISPTPGAAASSLSPVGKKPGPITPPHIPQPPSIPLPARTSVDDTIDHVIRMANTASLETSMSPFITSKPAARGRSRSKSKDMNEDQSAAIAAIISRVSRSGESPKRATSETPGPPPGEPQINIVQLPKPVIPGLDTRVEPARTPTQKDAREDLIDPKASVLQSGPRQPDDWQFAATPDKQDSDKRFLQQQLQMYKMQTPHGQQQFEKGPPHLQSQQYPEGLANTIAGTIAKQQFQQQQHRIDVNQHHTQTSKGPMPSPPVQPKTAIIYTTSEPFVPNKFSPAPGPAGEPGHIVNPTSMHMARPGFYSAPNIYQMSSMKAHEMFGQGPKGFSELRPPHLNIPNLSSGQVQAQLVRIPQVPSATTITKVDKAEEQPRSIGVMQQQQQHPCVIFTTAGQGPVIRTSIPPSHLQGRPNDKFVSQGAPRIEISGSHIQPSAGSPKAGRVPFQYESNQPQSGQHRIMQPQHLAYEQMDPTSPTAQPLDLASSNQNKDPNYSSSVNAKHSSTNNSSAPLSPYLQQSRQVDGRALQLQRPPQDSPQQFIQSPHGYPHFVPVSIAANLQALGGGQPSPTIFGPRPGSSEKSQADVIKGMPDRRPSPAHIPPHIASPHSDRGSAESPRLTPSYQRQFFSGTPSQLSISHSPSAVHQHPHARQTFVHPYAEMEEQEYAARAASGAYYQSAIAREREMAEREREASNRERDREVVEYERRRYSSPPPAHIRYAGVHMPLGEAPSSSDNPRQLQVQSPPLGSQVPPQGDSLLMLLQRYPIMWQGSLVLKNDSAACQMHFVSGNELVARDSFPSHSDGSTATLKISQRMRLEQTQLDGVARKLQLEQEHCMLLALPCGRDHMDVLQQSNNLRSGFITYLQLKTAAGIVNIPHPETQMPAYVIHIFPSCDFANENLARIAPDLLNGVADIAHLLIVIATV